MSLTMKLKSVYQISHCIKVKALNNHQNKRVFIYHSFSSFWHDAQHNCTSGPVGTAEDVPYHGSLKNSRCWKNTLYICINRLRYLDLLIEFCFVLFSVGIGFSKWLSRMSKEKNRDDKVFILENNDLWILPKVSYQHLFTEFIFTAFLDKDGNRYLIKLSDFLKVWRWGGPWRSGGNGSSW